MGIAAFLSREQTARKRIANSGENLIDAANPRIDLEMHRFSSRFVACRFAFGPVRHLQFPSRQGWEE
jgi:hypothetical protein